MFLPLSVEQVDQFPHGTPCILVPFRENVAQSRGEQLKQFVHHIQQHHPDWTVFILEQSEDGRKFNRGALLNAGVLFAKELGCTYVIFHDVDLLPLANIVPYYTAFPIKPIHIGKAWTQKYDYPNFLGGVLSMSIRDIYTTNGFPNQFWGWGGEDDSIRERLRKKKLSVYQPTLRGEGYKELTHIDTKQTSEWKNMRKWEDLQEDTGKDGVKTVDFTIVNTHRYTENIVKLTLKLV